MKRKSINMLLAVTAVLTLGITGTAGFVQSINVSAQEAQKEQITSGGILYLKVNPEIAIVYDDAGIVTKVEAKNDDGQLVLEKWQTDYVDDALDYAEENKEEITVVDILKKFETEYVGKPCNEVAALLVNEIGEAGFFIEETEEDGRQLVLELEEDSKLPDDLFLKEIIESVRKCLSEKEWHKQLELEGKSDYGMSDYNDTDYGPGNDGDTDYASYSDYGSNTDYGPNNDGATDYDGVVNIKDKASTVISINMDGTTNYDDTDYGAGSDGVTDYYNTDYGIHSDGVTDYSDYHDADGNSNYDDTDYDDSDYGSSAPVAPAPSTPAPSTPSGGNSNYNDTDYDDSDYGSSAPVAPAPSTPAPSVPSGGNSNYADTDYDDSDYGSSAPVATPAPSTPAPVPPTQAPVATPAPSTPAPVPPTQAPVETPAPATPAPATPAPVAPAPVAPAPSGGDSDYSDYGDSNYDDSDYGDSDYDD